MDRHPGGGGGQVAGNRRGRGARATRVAPRGGTIGRVHVSFATDESQMTTQEDAMAIKVGDRLPDGTLTEMVNEERAGCTVGPNTFNVADLSKGKKIAIFAVPGAFTPTCSAKHVPSYVQNVD